jgi:hypothetical protein
VHLHDQARPAARTAADVGVAVGRQEIGNEVAMCLGQASCPLVQQFQQAHSVTLLRLYPGGFPAVCPASSAVAVGPFVVEIRRGRTNKHSIDTTYASLAMNIARRGFKWVKVVVKMG